MSRSSLLWWVGLVCLTSAGCLGDFKTPSAYQSQRFYCDDSSASAFEALADSCRVDGSCSGAFSMRGTMQEQPLTVGATLQQATVTLVQSDPTAPEFWDIIRMTGSAPYFQFVFHLKSIGGDVTNTSPRDLDLRAGAGVLPNSLMDNLTDVGQTLQVGGENAEQQGLSDTGFVSFTKLTTTEVRGTFHGNFGSPADLVDGCFLMFPDQILTNPNPSP
jgi:hypothetical protein